MAEFRTGKIWGLDDTGAVGMGLTAAFAASATDTLQIYGPTDLACVATVSGVAASRIEYQLEVSFNGADWLDLPSLADAATLATFGQRVYAMPGALGAYTIVFHIPWKCMARLTARRVDGTAGTLLNVLADAVRVQPGASALAAMGGGGDAPLLASETLFDETPGADGTYDYPIEYDGLSTFLMDLIIVPGSGTVTLTVEAAAQDDGTAIAARHYVDVTNDVFGVASFTASDLLIDNAGVLKDAKSINFHVVVNTGGAGDAEWTGYYKASE